MTHTNLLALAFVLSLGFLPAWAQQTIRLWPEATGHTERDIPTLTMYAPDSARSTGAAVIICPGGSYRGLARHEGEDYAVFLARHGLRAFVLKYRLGPVYRYREITADGVRAMQIVRSGANGWGIDPHKIGIMGSSAGGHLASTMMTHFVNGDPASPDSIERVSSRPDFGILCYPVISMGIIGHAISREQFLGPNPPEELVKHYSNELHVTPSTPPCFIWHTFEDTTVSVENSLEFARALRRNGVPFDLHIYAKGRHGLGLGDKAPFANPHPWTNDLIAWLKGYGLIK